MPAFLLLALRYLLGSIAFVSGVIFVPLPLPFGIPLILISIALFAGSTRPILRFVVRLRRRFLGGRWRRRRPAAAPVVIEPAGREPTAEP